MTRLVLDDVSKSFISNDLTKIQAVSNVSLDVNEGEFVALVGPSGCGKTTILSMVAGMLSPDSGQVSINGTRMNGLTFEKLAYLFQVDTLLPWVHVDDNVSLGLRFKRVPRDQIIREVQKYLQLGGLEQFSKSYPHELSGGMRRRLALLQVLITKPEILLLDEPFSALDEPTRLELHKAALELVKGTTTVLITHDIAEAISLCDRVFVMTRRPGRIKAIHSISLPRPRNVYKLRETHAFLDLYRLIWQELTEEINVKGNGQHE